MKNVIAPISLRYRVNNDPISLRYRVTVSPISLRYRVINDPISLRYRVNKSPISLRYRVIISPISLRYRVINDPISLRYRVIKSPISERYRVIRSPISESIAPISVTGRYRGNMVRYRATLPRYRTPGPISGRYRANTTYPYPNINPIWILFGRTRTNGAYTATKQRHASTMESKGHDVVAEPSLLLSRRRAARCWRHQSSGWQP